MSYTYGGNKTKQTNPTLASNFSGLQSDGNRIALTGIVGNRMQSKDATGTPVYSPLSNASSSGVALTVPSNAAQISVFCTVICQVGEDSSYAYGVSIPANTYVTFDVANQKYVYLKPSNDTNTTSFCFNII